MFFSYTKDVKKKSFLRFWEREKYCYDLRTRTEAEIAIFGYLVVSHFGVENDEMLKKYCETWKKILDAIDFGIEIKLLIVMILIVDNHLQCIFFPGFFIVTFDDFTIDAKSKNVITNLVIFGDWCFLR